MDWEKLFAVHILERGYGYYCDNAVENMEVTDDVIKADVIGSEDYEVEISLSNGAVRDMYCSCPYAMEGRNCKHMAAVLYEWSESDGNEEKEAETTVNVDLFEPALTINTREKKLAAIEELVANAEDEAVRSFLVSVLAGDEKLLFRFYNTVNKQITKEDINNCIRQIDAIAKRYLGRNQFISYYEANGFISELEDIMNVEIRRMADDGDHLSAFEVTNHMFVLIGDVDMDDSDGGTSMLADEIYQLWLELLGKVNPGDKKTMFDWFTAHLDGSVIDYLEEYIEQIIMEEFKEKEYAQPKLDFIEQMIKKSEKQASEWSRDFGLGKWTIRYLRMLEDLNASECQIEDVCRKYWTNSSVRRYYIDRCMEKKEYDKALQVLDESISLDKQYGGLVSEYNRKKKEIYLLQGNKNAYVEQLWKLVLKQEAGDLALYKELKEQYTTEEWRVKREEIFKKLPACAHVARLYKEEKLYDRLLTCVLGSPGLYAVQEYENVLKKEYPEQILEKYREEVNKMAIHTGTRKQYSYLVSLLRKMQKMKGGAKLVAKVTEDWSVQYKNRPAMMEELRKL